MSCQYLAWSIRIIVFAVGLLPTCLADSPILKVTPPNQASEAGNDVVFECAYYPEDKMKTKLLDWLLPEGASVMNITRNQSKEHDIGMYERFSIENGKLTIRNVSEADEGYYTCKNNDGSLSHKSRLRIYEMPNYFTEGMIVVGVNGGLILVFLSCFIWTSCVSWKEYKRQIKLENSRLADTQQWIK